MSKIKLWVDDYREAPTGWVWVREYDSAILLLAAGIVKEISLDHDLGLHSPDGYQIAKWIEEQIAKNKDFMPLIINVHSLNPVGREQILACIKKIKELIEDAK